MFKRKEGQCMQVISVVIAIILSTMFVFGLNVLKRFLGSIMALLTILYVFIQDVFFDETGWMRIVFIIFSIIFGSSVLIGTLLSEMKRIKKLKS